ncbi:hypothetical protein PoB_002478600 [Plakobranchus ocellatus]|uniref:Uncharacterized protein n=1 Tax=Plakobranchus ocellatus TaxID=259542 RepID=A0AAV3ZQN7_9GAST|nr:hypothetical protein PoB_002478600 [Plakobranchus ocellatus]
MVLRRRQRIVTESMPMALLCRVMNGYCIVDGAIMVWTTIESPVFQHSSQLTSIWRRLGYSGFSIIFGTTLVLLELLIGMVTAVMPHMKASVPSVKVMRRMSTSFCGTNVLVLNNDYVTFELELSGNNSYYKYTQPNGPKFVIQEMVMDKAGMMIKEQQLVGEQSFCLHKLLWNVLVILWIPRILCRLVYVTPVNSTSLDFPYSVLTCDITPVLYLYIVGFPLMCVDSSTSHPTVTFTLLDSPYSVLTCLHHTRQLYIFGFLVFCADLRHHIRPSPLHRWIPRILC